MWLAFCTLCMWNIHCDRFVVHLARYLSIPKNLATSFRFLGVRNSTMDFTLACYGWRPWDVSRSLRNVSSYKTIWHLPLFRDMLLYPHVLNTLLTACKCKWMSCLHIHSLPLMLWMICMVFTHFVHSVTFCITQAFSIIKVPF